MTAPAPRFVFGVDTVAVARTAELLAGYGDGLARRIATAGEAAWADESAAGSVVERYAALLAVKESAIKCLAGRPPGFRWQNVEVDDVPPPGGAAPLPDGVARALSAFAAGVRLADERDVACRLTGAGLDRARTVLGSGAGAPIRGAARYGTVDGHVSAVACFWEDAHDE